jgi:hypothetical protein
MADVPAIQPIPSIHPVMSGGSSPSVSYTPSTPILYELARISSQSSELGKKVTQQQTVEMKERFVKCDQEIAEQITHFQERQKTEHAWSYMDRWSKAVSALFKAVGGIKLWTDHQPIEGSCLIASAAFDAFQALSVNLGIWDRITDLLVHKNEERQQKLKAVLPVIAFLFNTGLSVVGARHFSLKDISEQLSRAQNYLVTGQFFNQNYLSYKLYKADLKQTELTANIKDHNYKIELLSRLNETLTQLSKTTRSQLKRAFNKLLDANLALATR